MALVPAVCTQCGAQLSIDNSKEAAVCQFCSTPFVVQKAINQYNIQNIYTTANDNKVKLKNLYILARRALHNKEIDEAIDYYKQIMLIAPNNWEAVFYTMLLQLEDSNWNGINNSVDKVVDSIGEIIQLVYRAKGSSEIKNNILETISKEINDYCFSVYRYIMSDDEVEDYFDDNIRLINLICLALSNTGISIYSSFSKSDMACAENAVICLKACNIVVEWFIKDAKKLWNGKIIKNSINLLYPYVEQSTEIINKFDANYNAPKIKLSGLGSLLI